MVDLGQTPRTRRRSSRFLIVLLGGLLTAMVAAGALAQAGKTGLIGKRGCGRHPRRRVTPVA